MNPLMHCLSLSRTAITAVAIITVTAARAHAQPAERVDGFSVEVRADSITGQDHSFAILWPEGRVLSVEVETGPLFLACGRDSAALSGAVMLPAYGSTGDTLPVIVRVGSAAPDTLVLEGADGIFWFMRAQDVAPVFGGALQADSLVLEMPAPERGERARYAYGLAGLDSVLSRLGCAAAPSAPGRLAGRRIIQAHTAGVVEASAVVQPRPRLTGDVVRYLERNYPRELWDAGVEGQVLVRFRVTEDGSVDSATVTRSTNEAFNAAAVDAVRRFCFEPATAYGRRVKVWVEIPINFTRPDRRPPARPENPPPAACPPPRGS